MYTTVQKFGISTFFTYVHQGYIYLTKNTVKTVKLWKGSYAVWRSMGFDVSIFQVWKSIKLRISKLIQAKRFHGKMYHLVIV